MRSLLFGKGSISQHVDGMHDLPLQVAAPRYLQNTPLLVFISRSLGIQFRCTVMYSHIHVHSSLQLQLTVTPMSIVSVPLTGVKHFHQGLKLYTSL
jgi:hypothetical protein